MESEHSHRDAPYCNECKGCSAGVGQLKSIVDEWADQWELLTNDADEADEARNTARRFYRLSDPIGVDDIFEKYGDKEVCRPRGGLSSSRCGNGRAYAGT